MPQLWRLKAGVITMLITNDHNVHKAYYDLPLKTIYTQKTMPNKYKYIQAVEISNLFDTRPRNETLKMMQKELPRHWLLITDYQKYKL